MHKKNIITSIIIGTTFVLAGVGIFTSLRLYQLRDQAVAPNAPQSKLFAWDCTTYAFRVSQIGEVSIENASDRTEPAQKADVLIDNAKVATFDVPAFGPRSPKTIIGQVDVPISGSFDWKVVGSLDCQKSGSYKTQADTCKVVFDETDKLYCGLEESSVTVTGKVVSVPDGSSLQTSWYIVNPLSKKTSEVYKTVAAKTGDTFSIVGTWPGTSSEKGDGTVESHFGLNILDSNGNPIPECTGSLDYFWRKNLQSQCPLTPTGSPTTSPSATPTGTPIATPTSTPTTLPNLCSLNFSLETSTSTPTSSPQVACNKQCSTDATCKSIDSSYTCYPITSTCRLSAFPDRQECNIPATASPTPHNSFECNSVCSSNSECLTIGANYTCYNTGTNKRCRITTNTGSSTCQTGTTGTPRATSNGNVGGANTNTSPTPVTLPQAGIGLPTMGLILGGALLTIIAIVIAL